jgi:HK97 family phage major capsid protein
MPSYAQVMHDRRNDAIGTLRHLLDSAAAEGRDLSPEETEQADRIEADVKRFSDEAAREQRAAELQKAADEFRGVTAPVIEAARQERRDATDREMLVRALKSMSGGFESSVSESFESRALQSEGGSAIPTTFADFVTVYLRNLTPMFDPNIVTILNTPTGNPIVLPRWTADPAAGGTLTAEAGGITELDGTLSQVTLNAYKYAITSLYSAELAIDNVINIESLIAKGAARELAVDIGTELTTANGSGKPNGIVNAASNGGTAGGTSTNTSLDTFFGPVDLIELRYFNLAQGYRQVGVGAYMVASAAQSKMRKFRDSNKQFLWQPSLVAGVPDQFDGYPVYENTAMAAPASVAKSVLFGDLSAYYVRRMPTRVDVSKEYKFNTDQLAVRTIERVDGDLPDTAAIVYLICANT